MWMVDRDYDPVSGFMQESGLYRMQLSRADESWSRELIGKAPGGVDNIVFTPKGEPLLVTRHGVVTAHPSEVDPAGSADPAAPVEVDADDSDTAKEEPDSLGPAGVIWQSPFASASDLESGDIVIFTVGDILRLTRDPQTGQFAISQRINTKYIDSALIATGGGRIVLAREDGVVEFRDAQSLELQQSLTIDDMTPRLLVVAPDGKHLAVVSQERNLIVLDLAEMRRVPISVTGDGEISAAIFGSDGSLHVADRFPRVTTYSADLESSTKTRENLDGFAKWYVYLINPLRTVLPQPDELDLLIQQTLSVEGDAQSTLTADLRQDRGHFDPSVTIWSNALFVLFMLTISCLYVHYRDI